MAVVAQRAQSQRRLRLGHEAPLRGPRYSDAVAEAMKRVSPGVSEKDRRKTRGRRSEDGAASRHGGDASPMNGVARADDGIRHGRRNGFETQNGHASQQSQPGRTTTTES
jgi:hypothetical protein